MLQIFYHFLPSLHLEEQSCTGKDAIVITRQHRDSQKNDRKSDKLNKDLLSKRNSDSRKKISGEKSMTDKKKNSIETSNKMVGTNDINDDSEQQNVAEEIFKLTKSITKHCSSNIIIPRYGNLNKKVRSVKCLSHIYCRNMHCVKVSVFRVILVHIHPHSDYSVCMRENADQNISEYRLFSRSDGHTFCWP